MENLPHQLRLTPSQSERLLAGETIHLIPARKGYRIVVISVDPLEWYYELLQEWRDYITMLDIERCPFAAFTEDARVWCLNDDKRLKDLAVSRGYKEQKK